MRIEHPVDALAREGGGAVVVRLKRNSFYALPNREQRYPLKTFQIIFKFSFKILHFSLFLLQKHIYLCASKKIAMFVTVIAQGGGSKPERTLPLRMHVVFEVLPWKNGELMARVSKYEFCSNNHFK